MTFAPRQDVPLAPLTTLGLGGPARWFAEVTGVDGVREALRWSEERGLPVQVLGGGSNVVVSDAGFDGLVLRVRSGGLALRREGTGTRVVCGAGMPWDEVVSASVERGLSGIECLSGIPGWAGAAPIQNIGAYGQELSDTLRSVHALDRRSLEEVRLPAATCGLGYRTSRFKTADRDRFVILSLELDLEAGRHPDLRYAELEAAVRRRADPETLPPAEEVRLVRACVLELRRGKSMLIDPDDPDARSAGSFFLNPVLDPAAYERFARTLSEHGVPGPIPAFRAQGGVKVPAAWLVERAGFRKGERHGGVGISAAHALALVNRDGSTAQLLELASAIRDRVELVSGLRLEMEPTLVGAAGA